MKKYVKYNLTPEGDQPYLTTEPSGVYFEGGLDKIGNDYIGLLTGTSEQITQAISDCTTDFNMSELTGQMALDFFGKLKLKEIHDAFDLAPSLGYDCSLGFKVDSTREDLKNYQDLAFYMNANSITNIDINISNGGMRNTTYEELNVLILELIGYGLFLYQKKWTLETAVANATTVEEIQAISW